MRMMFPGVISTAPVYSVGNKGMRLIRLIGIGGVPVTVLSVGYLLESLGSPLFWPASGVRALSSVV
jgi:hypothetical protein